MVWCILIIQSTYYYLIICNALFIIPFASTSFTYWIKYFKEVPSRFVQLIFTNVYKHLIINLRNSYVDAENFLEFVWRQNWICTCLDLTRNSRKSLLLLLRSVIPRFLPFNNQKCVIRSSFLCNRNIRQISTPPPKKNK